MKKKLSLNQLLVNSFITELAEIKGGGASSTAPLCPDLHPDQSRQVCN